MLVTPDEPHLLEMIGATARRHNVPVRPLGLQALLHLPRIADLAGRVQPEAAQLELDRAADLVPPTSEWEEVGSAASDPQHWRLGRLDGEIGDYITGRFHYLRSPRRQSIQYGLWAGNNELPHAMVSLSNNDVPHLRGLSADELGRSRVLSRVFAFPSAPRNTLSRLISFAARRERGDATTALVTYVNPNLGFTGVSYRASGWAMVGSDVCRYQYLDGRYVTDRELALRLGPRADGHDAEAVDRFEVSKMPLEDLLVFGRGLVRRAQFV